MKTTYKKSKNFGHTLESMAPLGGLIDHDNQPYYLKISTYKGSKGIQSYVHVVAVGDMSETTVLFQDFAKWVTPSEMIARSTEKSVKKIHDETLMQFDEFYKQAYTHQQPFAKV